MYSYGDCGVGGSAVGGGDGCVGGDSCVLWEGL